MPVDYRNKIILAPMVRIGTLPIRLLSLDYGADLVYTEELIDYKLVQCKRVENAILGTVDFVWADGSIIYRTCPKEKGRVILQLGTADAKRAEKAAKLVEKDVDGIDVNMGCPKEFSVKGGMGAALLKTPEKAKEILTTLVNTVSVPVTCKIRILDTLEATLDFVRTVTETGISAIAIHGRRKEERPRHDNHNDIIKCISEVSKIPVIANGGSKEILEFTDIEKFRSDTGASSVMIARRAQWNPSIFRSEGKLPTDDIIRAYLRYAVDYDGHEMNVKYCMQQLYHNEMDSDKGQALQVAISVREMCALWDMESYYDEALALRRRREAELMAKQGYTSALRKRKLDDGSEIVEMPFKYCKKEYRNTTAPKMILYVWTKQNRLPQPQYTTTQNPEDRTFLSVVVVNGSKYGSTWWEKSKKAAEQAAAAVCLMSLGMWEYNHGNIKTKQADDGQHGENSSLAAEQKVVQGSSNSDDRGFTDAKQSCNSVASAVNNNCKDAEDVSLEKTETQPHKSSNSYPNGNLTNSILSQTDGIGVDNTGNNVDDQR